MASEPIEISDIVKKCKILLLDIEGTTTSISFVKDKLFPYAEENVKQFLENQWENTDVKESVSALRKLALEDKEKSIDGVIVIPNEEASKEDQIEGLVGNVKWQMSSDRKAGALKQLQGLIWKQGYDNGDIKGHVYDDVSAALEQWQSVEGQKIYIYSSGSVQAQKLLFGQSQAGNLLQFISGHFDTSVGSKQEAASYEAIAKSIGCKPEEILFLTDIVKEAEAAHSAGLHAALVSREGNAPLPEEATTTFPVLHSFAQLTASNKRKTDPQPDEQPAKVLKTNIVDDVKTVTEVEISEPLINDEKSNETLETMEVEEENTSAEEAVTHPTDEVEEKNSSGALPVATEIIVEEIVDSNIDVPICDVEPIVIEEVVEKTEKDIENMDTDSVSKEQSKTARKNQEESKNEAEKVPEESAPVAEETSPAIITEIEEIIDEKQILEDAEDITDEIQAVVEEPQVTEDIEKLHSVCEEIEKECDEILLKVQDVTNLDTIPVKPLLNPITEEEAMETENSDTNDIVDKILDTELELETKQYEDDKIQTVTSISVENKVETEVNKEVTAGTISKETESTCTIKSTDSNQEDMTVDTKSEINEKISPKKVDTKVEETNVKESKTDKSKTESNIELSNEEGLNVEGKKVKETNVEEKKIDESKVDNTEVDEIKVDAVKIKESESVETPLEVAVEQNIPKKDSESALSIPVEVKDCVQTDIPLNDVAESQINGATNGDTEPVKLNGDASKDDELSTRLSAQNGKDGKVNGSNGDSEKVTCETKSEAEVTNIKVKTVDTEEPSTDPIEQPTEA